jgi:hypothetical protein
MAATNANNILANDPIKKESDENRSLLLLQNIDIMV